MLPEEFGSAFVTFVKDSGLFPEVSQFFPALEKHENILYYDIDVRKPVNSARRYVIDITLTLLDESRSGAFNRMIEICDYITSNPFTNTSTLKIGSVYYGGAVSVAGTASPYYATARLQAQVFWMNSP